MNLILYEKGYIFGSILEEINSTKNKIIERVEQIMMILIPKQVCLYRKLIIYYADFISKP